MRLSTLELYQFNPFLKTESQLISLSEQKNVLAKMSKQSSINFYIIKKDTNVCNNYFKFCLRATKRRKIGSFNLSITQKILIWCQDNLPNSILSNLPFYLITTYPIYPIAKFTRMTI